MKFILYFLLLLPMASANTNALDAYQTSLSADFAWRIGLPQTEVPSSAWTTCCGSWGPRPNAYPLVQRPPDYDVQWMRDRVIRVAEHFFGLPYAHKHIPAMGGLDCSNFTSWVYNFGFGIQIVSNVHTQAEMAGRKINESESLQKGDLLYFWNSQRSEISHAAIFVDSNHLIDSTDGEVALRSFSGSYKIRFAWARRIFEQ